MEYVIGARAIVMRHLQAICEASYWASSGVICKPSMRRPIGRALPGTVVNVNVNPSGSERETQDGQKL